MWQYLNSVHDFNSFFTGKGFRQRSFTKSILQKMKKPPMQRLPPINDHRPLLNQTLLFRTPRHDLQSAGFTESCDMVSMIWCNAILFLQCFINLPITVNIIWTTFGTATPFGWSPRFDIKHNYLKYPLF